MLMLGGDMGRSRGGAHGERWCFCMMMFHRGDRAASEAYFGKGTKLTVLEPERKITPPKVVILPPSKNECEDRQEKLKKTLVCVASGFYPDHVSVSWTVNSVPVTNGVASDHTALRVNDAYQITSRLRVEAKMWYKEGTVFSCNVSFFNGTENIYTLAYVDAGPVWTKPDSRGKFMTVTQTAKLSYIIVIIKNVVYGVFVTILAWKLGLGRTRAAAKK